MNEILTPIQIAERLNVNRETVYTLLRKGEIPSFKVGKLWRVTEEQFHEYLNHGQEAEQQSGERSNKLAPADSKPASCK